MATLDRNRPHGQVFNDDQGRHWHQDGKYFDFAGDEVRDEEVQPRPAAPRPPVASKGARPKKAPARVAVERRPPPAFTSAPAAPADPVDAQLDAQ